MGFTRKTRRESDAISGDTAINHANSYDSEKVEVHDADANQSWKGKEDPFADEGDGTEGTKYKTLEWWQAGIIMIAETISLGILSLPSVLAGVGFVPGIILILGLGVIATYTGYVIGQFKLRYMHVHSMADAGEILLGPIGREIFGAAQVIFLVFTMGSHVLTFSIMLNTISNHGACTIIFGLVGALIQLLFTLPRTLGSVSYMAIGSFISITAAVVTTMIGVGIEKPDFHPMATVTSDLAPAFLATTNIIFAFAGHVAFFGFISELKDPRSYPKALVLLQICDTTMYLIVAAVVYTYAGQDVASPALGSASPLVAKVAYGLAIPTIIVAGVINGHVASKYIYVRMFRGTGLMSKKNFKSYAIWGCICLTLWILAWIVAEAIPVFNDLLSLISALFASWFTYGLSGVFWLHLNRGQYTKNWKKMCLTAVNVATFLMGAVICGMGLWASGTSIAADASSSNGSFSCADNSGQ